MYSRIANQTKALIGLGATAVLLLTACSSTTSDNTNAPTATASEASTAPSNEIVNAWVGPPIDLSKIPLGDGDTSTKSAKVGSVFSCQGGNPGAGGATDDVPWIHGKTWNLDEKLAVKGDIAWPAADFSVSVSGGKRTIKTNALPVDTKTGKFPVSQSDPAYEYDRNPNSIDKHKSTIKLPTSPTPANKVNCLPMGEIGIMLNGVFLFNALDAPGRDAVAHEIQDLCDGHPEQGDTYHYHDVAQCLQKSTTGSSTVVGWANDGYPVVLERDPSGNLPTNADLDECHGRTSEILIDGQLVSSYHYSATVEYPYTLGCFHGTDVVS
ncbi:MAG: YHYH protein [Actinobacteria bacterium]|nr:YHYH protein [Actinomycetota bacterium]